MKQLGDGGLDYEVRPGYLPTASPSEQSTRSGKSNDTKEYQNCKWPQLCGWNILKSPDNMKSYIPFY